LAAGAALAVQEPDDEDLVAGARAGDQASFEALVLRHRRAVEAVAGRFFFARAEVEDVAQEVFVKAYLNLSRLQPATPFRFWIRRVAVNCSIDRLRREKRRVERPAAYQTETEGEWLARHLASRSLAEHRALENAREARSLVAKVLPQVAPKDRAALYLLDGEGHSVAEVATLLGWSQTNVKVRAFRARRRLRRAIEELARGAEAGVR
jgi:RNA polymerase sigma-70 factor (ECF subfamily)